MNDSALNEIEILTDLPNLREDHVDILEEMGILSLSDLKEMLQDEGRAKEVMDVLVGVGPRTIDSWRRLLSQAYVPPSTVDEWERVAEDEPALEPEEATVMEGDTECEEVLCTLAELIAFDTSKEDGLKAAMGYVEGRLKDAGLNVTVSGKKAPVLIARKGKKGLMMVGHLDTLPRGKMKKKMQGVTDGDLVYGRGVADMKGAVAAMICAAETMAAEDLPFTMALTTDSLDGGKGIKALVDNKLLKLAKAVWLFRPTCMIPVAGETGSELFLVEVRGDEPIFGMASFLERLRAYTMEGNDILFNPNHVKAGKKGATEAPSKAKATVEAVFALPYTADYAGSVISNRLGELEASVKRLDGVEPAEYDRSVPLADELADLTCSCLAAMPADEEAVRLAKVNPKLCICGPGDTFDTDEDEYISICDVMETYEAILEMVDLSQVW